MIAKGAVLPTCTHAAKRNSTIAKSVSAQDVVSLAPFDGNDAELYQLAASVTPVTTALECSARFPPEVLVKSPGDRCEFAACLATPCEAIDAEVQAFAGEESKTRQERFAELLRRVSRSRRARRASASW